MYDTSSNRPAIALTPKELKALDSGTRVEILKLLRERNHTLSEMSKRLKLTPPSVKQHLGILVDSEMIEQLDEGRKWKYYSLTRKGKGIAAGDHGNGNVFIVLATGSICLLITMGILLTSIFVPGFLTGGEELVARSIAAPVTAPAAGVAESAADTSIQAVTIQGEGPVFAGGNTALMGWAGIASLLVAFITGYAAAEWRRQRKAQK